jgi:hypothetical protein
MLDAGGMNLDKLTGGSNTSFVDSKDNSTVYESFSKVDRQISYRQTDKLTKVAILVQYPFKI